MNISLPSSLHLSGPASSAPEPYRVFFPFGIFGGILGVGYWGLYSLGFLEVLPVANHVDIQIQTFLFSFVLGFLLTALPRFSGTSPATWIEILWFGSLLISGAMVTTLGWLAMGRAFYLIGLFSLLVFAGKRFRKRSSSPPASFVFVGLAILLGFLGAGFRLAASVNSEWAVLETSGRRILAEGMMLALVLGIGGKLFPLFFGHNTFAPDPNTQGTKHDWRLPVIAVAFGLTFFLEYVISEGAGLWTRLIIASLVFFPLFKIHRAPKNKGVLVRSLWLSCWVIYLSLLGAAMHPQYRIAVLHVLFIAGFGILILSVSTRVILAHGNYPLALEKTSKALFAGTVLLVCAGLFRSTADLFPFHYFQMLGVAALFWVSGLATWGAIFTKRIIFTHGLEKNSACTTAR